jgi:hypothetical protein
VRALARAVGDGVLSAARTAVRTRSGSGPGRRPTPRPSGARSGPVAPGPVAPVAGYPGDFTGTAQVAYDPREDGDADPGEVVWGWVPFEEDHSRGKDRPALVVGRDGRWVLALMLTSKDHDGDADRRSRYGRDWVDIGSGDWDSRGRPSEVRLDRVLRLDPDGIRREGGRLDRTTFDRVAAALRERYGWT